MTTSPALPPTLASYVSDFVARARRRSLARAAGVAAAMLSAWALACCGVDRLAHLPPVPRLSLLAAGLAGVAIVLARPLRAVRAGRVNLFAAASEIERHDPRFAQSLVTVVSRLLGPAEHRGSDEMLYRLLTDVSRKTETGRGVRALRAHRVLLPWAAFASLVVLAAFLLRVPDLGLPRLLVRFAAPLADVDPVTTTRLEVTPGDRDVVQSEALHVAVTAHRLRGDDPVWVWLKEDGGAWVRRPMARAAAPGDGKAAFTFTLAAVERDLRYYVTGGDAGSHEYRVRALRRPAVAEFRVHYAYPPYASRPPLTVTNTDGLVEAPAGTDATLTLTATEPLQVALLTVGGEKMLMARTDRDNVRTATFKVLKTGPYELDMISTREVAGGGPAGTLVRALTDQRPLVRMPQAGENLRLNPRDIIPLSFQVLDDFGLEALSLKVQVNGAAPVDLPLPLFGDVRRQEGTFNLDLATIKLGMGDVVAVTLAARDGAGQQGASEPLQVLLAPRSIDLETHQRITELESSAQLSSLVIEELEATAKALDEATKARGKNPEAESAAVGRGNRFLTTATDTAVLMRQSVLRSIVRSRPDPLATALANVVDSSQLLTSAAEDLFRTNGVSGSEGAREKLDRVRDRARQTQVLLKSIAEGERAAAVLADRENLLSSEKKAAAAEPEAAERIRQTLRRAREEVEVSVKGMGLDPDAANLDDLLRGKIDAAQAALRSQQPVDYAAAARDWSGELQKDPLRRLLLDERFASAAQAEALRPASDLLRARDLQFCGKAAARLATDAASDKYAGRAVAPAAPEQFVGAVAALQLEHEMNRRPPEARPAEEAKRVRAAAAQARALVAAWAGEAGAPAPAQVATTSPSTNPAGAAVEARLRQRRAEELAVRASAEAAARDYSAARNSDAQLLRNLSDSLPRSPGERPTSQPGAKTASAGSVLPLPPSLLRDAGRVDRLTAKAEKIDHIQTEQDALADQTKAAGPSASGALAGRQSAVAERIADAGDDDPAAAPAPVAAARRSESAANDPSWRGRATATLLRAQEQLAAMPQDLTRSQEAAASLRQAAARADAAKRDAASATPERKAALEMAARQADQDRADAEERLRGAGLPVVPSTAAALAAALAPFEPESTSAREIVSRQLLPALQSVEIAARSGDAAAGERAAAEARAAIVAAQAELARAQQLFTERDPLVAAKWFARAAADSLSRSPPDLTAAQRRQLDTSLALSRAWDRTIHQAAAQRLALVPSMQSLFGVAVPPPPPGSRGGPGDADKPAPPIPDLASVREWGRLRPRELDELNAPVRESEPAGYERALQLYFGRLGQVQDGTK